MARRREQVKLSRILLALGLAATAFWIYVVYKLPESIVARIDTLEVKLGLGFFGSCVVLFSSILLYVFLYIPGPRRMCANLIRAFLGMGFAIIVSPIALSAFNFDPDGEVTGAPMAQFKMGEAVSWGGTVLVWVIIGCVICAGFRLICDKWRLPEEWDSTVALKDAKH